MPTIPENSTPQEVFDYVAKHLIKQGKQAVAGSNCAYRSPEGLSCAVGCLITDEEYNVNMEGESSTLLSTRLGSPFWKTHEGLLIDLQLFVHDAEYVRQIGNFNFDLAKLNIRLILVAERHNLNTEALNANHPA